MAKTTEQMITKRYHKPRDFQSIAEYLRTNNEYVLPYCEGITTTEKYDDNSFHVSMMVEDKAVKSELVDRTSFTDEEMKGKFIGIDAFFFNEEDSPETNGINVNVVDEENGEELMEMAKLTDEEKLAFYNKVVEIVPESEPFVRHSIGIVLARMEQEQPKQVNNPIESRKIAERKVETIEGATVITQTINPDEAVSTEMLTSLFGETKQEKQEQTSQLVEPEKKKNFISKLFGKKG